MRIPATSTQIMVHQSILTHFVYYLSRVSLRKSSKRKRHTQRNDGRSRCSRRESTVLLGVRAVDLPHVDGRVTNNKRSKERSKLPLLEFLSEDEDDTYLTNHEKLVSSVTSDMMHAKGQDEVI